jgi:hypothetical protein
MIKLVKIRETGRRQQQTADDGDWTSPDQTQPTLPLQSRHHGRTSGLGHISGTFFPPAGSTVRAREKTTTACDATPSSSCNGNFVLDL